MKSHEKRVYFNHIRRLKQQNCLLLETLRRERCYRIEERQQNLKILRSPIRKFMAILEESVFYYSQDMVKVSEETRKSSPKS